MISNDTFKPDAELASDAKEQTLDFFWEIQVIIIHSKSVSLHKRKTKGQFQLKQ